MIGALIGLALLAVSGMMIWKTSRNYLARKPRDESSES